LGAAKAFGATATSEKAAMKAPAATGKKDFMDVSSVLNICSGRIEYATAEYLLIE
jgi:hypothetical protein